MTEAFESLVDELLGCSERFNLPDNFLLDYKDELSHRLNLKLQAVGGKLDVDTAKIFVNDSVRDLVIAQTAG